MRHKQGRYASDLTDQQWVRVKALLPLERSGPGRPLELDMREVVNSILYVVRTGCQWEYLPKDYPNYHSVYYHYRKWCLDGTWRRLNETVRQQERQRCGRNAQPSAAILDSQSTKTTEAGGVRGYDAGKKVNGRKRHILVDTLGNLLEVVVHAADIQDRDGAKFVFNKLSLLVVASLLKVWADGGYRGQLINWLSDHFAIALEIVQPPSDAHSFQVLPRRWVVERTLAWMGKYRRLSKDYESCTLSSEGVVYIASIHTMLRRLDAPT